MKKYLVLTGILFASVCLHADEHLVFNTVLSKPVASFWELETTTCAYPDVAGGGSTQSQQIVVNFGPTNSGGTIYLNGGPMKVDTLLMEDETQLQTTGTELMFPSDGKLTVYPDGNVKTDSILINNLILPNGEISTINVNNTAIVLWTELNVKSAAIHKLGEFVFQDTENLEESSASFTTLPTSTASEDTPNPTGYNNYLRI